MDTAAAWNWAVARRPFLGARGVYTLDRVRRPGGPGERSREVMGGWSREHGAHRGSQGRRPGGVRELVEPYRPELHVHCYRILGSVQDAEDALQETLLEAWRGLAGFERRASVRTWLYSVATNRALNMLRAAKRRPQVELPFPQAQLPEPTRLAEPLWLEPYPDVLIENELESPPGPEARYETKEAISLAFVTALQLLPARQRAVLILRDVLGFRAAEVAQMLDSSVESVTSALKRARTTLESRLPHVEPPPQPDSPAERELVGRLAAAFEGGLPARRRRSEGAGELDHARRAGKAARPEPSRSSVRSGEIGRLPARYALPGP